MTNSEWRDMADRPAAEQRDAWEALTAERDRLQERVAELEEAQARTVRSMTGHADMLAEDLDAAEERVRVLEGALRSVKSACAAYEGEHPAGYGAVVRIVDAALRPASPDVKPPVPDFLSWDVSTDGGRAQLHVHTSNLHFAFAWAALMQDFITRASGKPGNYRSDASPDAKQPRCPWNATTLGFVRPGPCTCGKHEPAAPPPMPVRKRFFLARCKGCGYENSSEAFVLHRYAGGDDADVACPACGRLDPDDISPDGRGGEAPRCAHGYVPGKCLSCGGD